MNRHLRFVALILLAVWLPVTKHCMLEAAGFLEIASESTDASGCCVDSQPCDDDSCEIVEQGLTATSGASVKVPVARLLASAEYLFVPPIADGEETGPSSRQNAASELPLDWVPAWHFEHRTAPPSRAPSLLSA